MRKFRLLVGIYIKEEKLFAERGFIADASFFDGDEESINSMIEKGFIEEFPTDPYPEGGVLNNKKEIIELDSQSVKNLIVNLGLLLRSSGFDIELGEYTIPGPEGMKSDGEKIVLVMTY